ncbi:MAG: hypothetical protein JWM92_407 [Candidatus Nomurabacteria bacterium]|nr:hypothetical protein [Candidatus Nomurabacteria bacterium]
MTHQYEMFPKPEKPPIIVEQEMEDAVRQEYNFLDKSRPVTPQSDGKWYTTDYDGTPIELGEWNKRRDMLDEVKGRKDFN